MPTLKEVADALQPLCEKYGLKVRYQRPHESRAHLAEFAYVEFATKDGERAPVEIFDHAVTFNDPNVDTLSVIVRSTDLTLGPNKERSSFQWGNENVRPLLEKAGFKIAWADSGSEFNSKSAYGVLKA